MADLKKLLSIGLALGKGAASIATNGASDKVLDLLTSDDSGLSQPAKDEIAKLRETNSEKFKELDETTALEYQRLAVQDRESARSLHDVWMARILAFVGVGSFVFCVILILRGGSKVESAFAGGLVGYLAAIAQQVYNFVFGSSAGSAAKTAIFEQQAKGK
jgi:hypothetical protein